MVARPECPTLASRAFYEISANARSGKVMFIFSTRTCLLYSSLTNSFAPASIRLSACRKLVERQYKVYDTQLKARQANLGVTAYEGDITHIPSSIPRQCLQSTGKNPVTKSLCSSTNRRSLIQGGLLFQCTSLPSYRSDQSD